MASKVGTANNKIILGVAWQGSPIMNQGLSKIASLQLIFPDLKTQVSVELPGNLSPDKVEKLPFTCHRVSGETHPEELRVPIEQIKGLTMRAGVVQESPGRGAIQKRDLPVTLEWPETLEMGQTYQLLITSDFKARLIEDPKSADVKAILGYKAVILFAKTMVTQYLTKHLWIHILSDHSELAKELQKQPPDSSLTDDRATKGLMDKLFETEIKNLEPEALRSLDGFLRDSPAGQSTNPLIVGPAALACLRTIGNRGLTNIIRSMLGDIARWNKSERLQTLINQVSEEWGNSFLSTL